MILENDKINVINKTSLKDYFQTLKRAISTNCMIILIGDFKVNYQGRASSQIDYGERLLIIKKDKSVLIHKDKGAVPLNWQPPGNLINITFEENKVIINVLRKSPRERLLITVKRIISLQIFNLRDNAEFIMYASEKQMQEAVIKKPNLIFKGFKPITIEKTVKPGFIDVYGYDKEGNFVIIELKRITAKKTSVLQLKKYLDIFSGEIRKGKVRGILAAPNITKEAEILLNQLGLEFKKLDPHQCAEIVKKDVRNKITDYLNKVEFEE
jgi:RecB family endonuclease NucS